MFFEYCMDIVYGTMKNGKGFDFEWRLGGWAKPKRGK